jgi:hemolysin activation/secretion protein
MALTRYIIVATIALFLSGTSWAQQQPSPGAVQRSIDRAVTPSVKPEEPAPETEKADQPKRAPVAEGGPRFLVKQFSFRGNGIYGDDELRARIANRQGEKLTLAEIYAVADELTDFYHAQGHSLAVVTVPAQEVKDGQVLLEVVEGRLGTILLRGNEGYSDEFLMERFNAIQPGEVIQFGLLESELLKLNDLPGLTARSVIQPGAEFGTSDLLLNMAEKPYDARFALDNFGREALGEFRLSASGSLNNLSGRGDQLFAGLTHTESGLLTSGSLGYSLPVGDKDGRLSAFASRADYIVAGLPVDGISDTFNVDYSEPLMRSRNRNMAWNVGLTHFKPKQNGIAASPIDADLTVIDAGLNYQANYSNKVSTTASARIQTNFKTAKRRADGTLDGGQRLRLELQASAEKPILPGWSIYGRGLWVYSPDELNDMTKYSMGGPSSVRAYLVTEVSGDTGLEGSLELRRFFLARKGLPGVARLFVDAATTRCRVGPCLAETELGFKNKSSTSRTGWGLGLTLYPADRYTIEAQWAQHLDHYVSPDEDENGRVWIFLSADI